MFEKIDGQKIKQAIKEAGYTQEGFAEKIGTNRVVISNWIRGIRNIKPDTLKKIAELTNKSLKFFIDNSAIEKVYKEPLSLIPILGTSSATKEKFIVNEQEGFLNIPKAKPNQFAIKVEGDCMVDPEDPENSIYNGSYIIVDPDEPAANGDVVLVRIDKEYSTIKRFFLSEDRALYVPDNPNCKTIEKHLSEVDIIGKVVNVHKVVKKKSRKLTEVSK
jgi:SOS-response transcriptional repressor LexA